MSKNETIEFSVSPVFQKRLVQAFAGEERSKAEIAKDIGISKDVFIRAWKAGLVPSMRTLIKIADYLEESLDYLLGFSDESAPRKTAEGACFYRILEELKDKSGKKYGAIASAIGIYRSQFNSWKKNNSIPSPEICYQLALYFKVSLDSLLARE